MKKNITFLFVVIIMLSLIAKLSGLIRESVTGYYFGAGEELDIFYFVYSIPELFMTGIVAALSIAIIPTLSQKEPLFCLDNRRFIFNLVIIGSIFFVLICLLAILFNHSIMDFILRNTSGKFSYSSVFNVYLISMIQLIPTFLLGVFQSIVTKQEKYKTVTLISIPFNALIILSIMIYSDHLGVQSIGLGMLGAVLVQVFILWLILRKDGLNLESYKVDIKFDSTMINFMYLLLPVYFGTIIQRVGIFVDRTIASTLQTGSISALSYADRLIQMVIMIVINTIGMIMFSKISSAKDDPSHSSEIMNKSIIFSFASILPITGFLLVYGRDIINILFNRGEFDEQALNLTTMALCGYSIGLIGICIRYLLNRVYFVNNNVKTPTINTIVFCIVNIVLSIVLARMFGLLGIALAYSITMILASVALVIDVHRRYKIMSSIRWGNCVKVTLLSIVLLGFWMVLNMLLPDGLSSLIKIVISGISGAFLFTIMLLVVKVEGLDIMQFIRQVQRKILRNNVRREVM
ncbi:murein biosynthesis integral membrane protein MurJ [Paenibacillus jiagnxiensis]|uniref:murein biosynthesis integral membrane protein MurJ n=1 Tax=Paenibacillus jiagnxiensis TaxID=3228926 RepID=UPI0033A1D9DF